MIKDTPETILGVKDSQRIRESTLITLYTVNKVASQSVGQTRDKYCVVFGVSIL